MRTVNPSVRQPEASQCYNAGPSGCFRLHGRLVRKPTDLADTLLALVASTSWDGGSELLRTLSGILEQSVPFDAAEVGLCDGKGIRRWSLGDAEEWLAASDLLFHVALSRAPIRFDDLPEMASFPRTQSHLKSCGLRSLLALPLGGAGGPDGAVVLARDFGWAFAGAPLGFLAPVAGMAGLCLERALALTALRKEVDRSRGKKGRPSASE